MKRVILISIATTLVMILSACSSDTMSETKDEAAVVSETTEISEAEEISEASEINETDQTGYYAEEASTASDISSDISDSAQDSETEEMSPQIPDGALDDMIPLVNAHVSCLRLDYDNDYHIATCANEHDFWNIFSAYCNSNVIPENGRGVVFSPDGKVFITRSELMDMAYALFDDFDGTIPDTEFDEYGPIDYDEEEGKYLFWLASMHDYIYKGKSQTVYNDDGTITVTYLYEESFWGDREGPATYTYDVTFRVNDHVNEMSDNPYYYTITSVAELSEWEAEETDSLSEYFTNEQLDHIRKWLGIPDDLPVVVEVGNLFYWEGTGKDLVHVSFYYDGDYVAGADCFPYTDEPQRNIFPYYE